MWSMRALRAQVTRDARDLGHEACEAQEYVGHGTHEEREHVRHNASEAWEHVEQANTWIRENTQENT